MKKIILGLLLTGAFAFATEAATYDTPTTTSETTASQQENTARVEHHMPWYVKEALRTQSPGIHLAKVRHHEVIKPGTQINVNKTTIVAFVPSPR